MNETKHRVLIAEDHDIARLGLRLTLEKMSDVEVVGEAADGDSVLALTEQLQPSIILMDINLPGISGIQATKIIKNTHPHIFIIMFTSDSSDETVFAALGAGADGYCLKNVSAEELRTAIDSVSQGAAWLNPGIGQRVLKTQVEARAKLAGVEQPALIHQSTLQSGSTRTESPVVIKPGVVLAGRFKIEETIGAGGVSTVYRGKDLSIGRMVAIKMLHQQPLTDEKEVQRFLLEAKTASAISHPNVITIFDFGVTPQGQPYMVMDYIDGISLDELIKTSELTLQRIIGIFIQVCDAMIAAHKKGIIHRDLKPSNIMLVKTDDGTDSVKLVDFGMAKFFIESEDLKLSKTGDLFGTPLYMSPEHFQGLKLDTRSDIYSLGCVLYETLTGNPPFNGTSLFEVMNYHLNEKPSRLPFLRPGKALPDKLDSLLFSMLAKTLDERPASMAEIKVALLQI